MDVIAAAYEVRGSRASFLFLEVEEHELTIIFYNSNLEGFRQYTVKVRKTV